MISKHFSVFILMAFMNLTIGCTSSNRVWMDKEEFVSAIPNVPNGLDLSRIAKLKLKDGPIITFNKDGALYKDSYLGKDSVIVGYTEAEESSITKLNQVDVIWIENTESNDAGTVLTAVGIVAGVVLIGAIIIAVGLSNAIGN